MKTQKRTNVFETNSSSAHSLVILTDETLSEINTAISTHKAGNKIEGESYTNGNLNKII